VVARNDAANCNQQGEPNVASDDTVKNPALPEPEKVGPERPAADQAFADKLAKRSPPDNVEQAAINKARKRTRARARRVEMLIEDRGGNRRIYPYHSDEDGNLYRLADAFGTRSLQFVNSMLRDLGKATEDHSESKGFFSGSPDQLGFNAALAIIDGVRPKDEIEAMLAAHMAVANLVLLDLGARMREAAAGRLYQGDGGIQRLQTFGNLTAKFMRTFAMQVEALAKKRRKVTEQRVTVKHVHIHSGAQAIVGNVTHAGGRGTKKNDHRPYGRAQETAAAPAIPKGSPVRGANEEREAMPIASDEERSVPAARRRKR
jgi:hypothetical protein